MKRKNYSLLVALSALSLIASQAAATAQVSSPGTSPGLSSTSVIAPAGNVAGATLGSFLTPSVPINSNAFGNYAPPPPGIPSFTTTMFDQNGNAVLVRTTANGAIIPNSLGYPMNGPVSLVSPSLYLNANGLIQNFGVSNGPGNTTTALGSQYNNAATAGTASANGLGSLTNGINGFASGPNGVNNGTNGQNLGNNGQNTGTGVGVR